MNTVTANATAYVTVGPGDSLKVIEGRTYKADNPRVRAAVEARPDLFDGDAEE